MDCMVSVLPASFIDPVTHKVNMEIGALYFSQKEAGQQELCLFKGSFAKALLQALAAAAGIYSSDAAFNSVKANAQVAKQLSTPLPNCSPASHKSASVPAAGDCTQTRVNGEEGTG